MEEKQNESFDVAASLSQITNALGAIRDDIAGLTSRVSAMEVHGSPGPAGINSLRTPARDGVDESFFANQIFLGATADNAPNNQRRTQLPTQAGRRSLLERNVRNTANSSITLTMQAKQPAYDHIKLSSANSVTQVFTFIDEAIKYQTQYGIKLPLPSLVEEVPRDHLIASEGGMNLTQFYELEDEALFKMLTKQIRPKTPLAFYDKLVKHIDFVIPKSYKPTPSDFKLFLGALRTYRHKFLKLFEVLAADNDANIPEVKNKDGGLLKAFLDKIPFEYGKRVYQTLKVTKFTEFHDFLKLWDAAIKKHETFHEGAVQLKECFGGSDWFARNQGGKINAIALENDSGSEAHTTATAGAPVADGAHTATDLADDDDDDDAAFVDHWISVLSDSSTKPKEPFVCLSKMVNGECKKPNCPYDHNEARLNEQRKRHVELCLEQLKKSSGRKSSVSVLQHTSKEAEGDDSA